ncbi:hypothetical protein BXY70_2864 [Roseovarius halotolerans]|uniref:Uncharacterized protein n=2 Tax=Roseovarius halotolerans TaxID=505353 RepID=A0A1X6ZGW2_9RHOB|nr:hypothetical protein [Roseovarius halotolerans]RKT30868.1 hypothetical protein BXY70_2864 [Roseovarius halotolerans]SLN50739.1 hypothetical protein ROH8110_02760 [Roseovarius halotolerans]
MPFNSKSIKDPSISNDNDTGANAGFLGGALSRLRKKPDSAIEEMMKRIILPSLPVSDEEMARATHQDLGLKLARQEQWDAFSERIVYADDCRLATPGGESASLLLAFGARGDVVAAAEDAIHDGAAPDMAGIEALEEVLEEHRGSHAVALVVALAHFDIGWAWQIATTEGDLPAGPDSAERIDSHFQRAAELLAPYDPEELDAPSLAAAKCALLATQPHPDRRVADAYEKLIDLDPDCQRHMRALGHYLLPRYYGSYDQLELEARRTAARTGDVWASGAYTWVYLDALATDDAALKRLDAEYFIEGLRNILAIKRDQHVTNQLAAFCAITMAPDRPRPAPLPESCDQKRALMHECLDWILAEHLQELHPLVWSQTLMAPGLTPALPSRRALVSKGRQAALRAIALRFAEDIADGSSIAFSSSGMYRLPAL